jgi:predicted Holliday junction resolvase-like endonuclease
MKTIIIGVGIIVLLFLCLVLAIKFACRKSDEAKDNKKIADAYKQNAEELKDYTEKVQEETVKKEESDKEIENAKTKEDLRNHARATAKSNNDKLHNDSGSKTNTSTKTRKTRTKSTGK